MAIGQAEAFQMLMNEEIDALFYVDGVPTKLFADTSIDGSKFHLLDILEPELLATYSAVEIPGGTYPFQPDPVNSVAVKAVLMTYDYKPEKNDYHKSSCEAVSNLSSLILTNLERLRATGHPKWKEVDLKAVPPGWQVGECVKTGMAADYKASCSPAETAGVANNNNNVDQEYLNLLKQRFRQ